MFVASPIEAGQCNPQELLGGPCSCGALLLPSSSTPSLELPPASLASIFTTAHTVPDLQQAAAVLAAAPSAPKTITVLVCVKRRLKDETGPVFPVPQSHEVLQDGLGGRWAERDKDWMLVYASRLLDFTREDGCRDLADADRSGCMRTVPLEGFEREVKFWMGKAPKYGA